MIFLSTVNKILIKTHTNQKSHYCDVIASIFSYTLKKLFSVLKKASHIVTFYNIEMNFYFFSKNIIS